jgi:pimeloyl-ACP methyl ester carboxylesterase
MWVPLAKDLARDHTVVVPDLRGMGLSAKPAGGYDKKTQAGDVAGILDALKIERAALVTHDIGNMVGYAFAAQYRNRVTCFVAIDAPLPGVGPWEKILKNPLLWHFRFGGPDMERLVAGRERIYLDRFWNEFSATPKRFSEAARRHYAKLYSRPGAMHAGFAQFAAFDQDAVDNRAFVAAGKLDMPVLALGGEKSFGTTMAAVMRFAANDVEEGAAARASARKAVPGKTFSDAHHSDSANKSVHDVGSIHQGEPNVRPCRPFSQDSSPGPFDLHHRRMSVLSIGIGYHRSDRSDDPTRRHQLGTVPY